MKTFLVTGGAGFIGSNYIRYMFNKYRDEIRIINLDALTYAGNPANLSDSGSWQHYTFVKGDICDKKLVERLFDENEIDYVVHFAAESHVDNSISNPEVFVVTNVLGTAALLNAAKKNWKQSSGGYKPGKKYLQVSTDEVYGSLGAEGYFTETSLIDPHSPYSASKAGGDMLVKSYFDTYGMPVNITRCSNNYGPRQFPEKLIPLMIKNALAGEKLPVYGDGKNIRDWLYVDDHARAIDMVAQNGRAGEIYNIGGHNEKTNIDVVSIIINTLRGLMDDNDPRKAHVTNDLISYVEDRKGHDRRYAIDPSKINAELGWSPETAFEDGIKLTVKWYLDNAKWVADIISGEYRNKLSNI